jgi:hypothetical protein
VCVCVCVCVCVRACDNRQGHHARTHRPYLNEHFCLTSRRYVKNLLPAKDGKMPAASLQPRICLRQLCKIVALPLPYRSIIFLLFHSDPNRRATFTCLPNCSPKMHPHLRHAVDARTHRFQTTRYCQDHGGGVESERSQAGSGVDRQCQVTPSLINALSCRLHVGAELGLNCVEPTVPRPSLLITLSVRVSSFCGDFLPSPVAQVVCLFDEEGTKREQFKTKPGPSGSTNYIVRSMAWSPDSTRCGIHTPCLACEPPHPYASAAPPCSCCDDVYTHTQPRVEV